MWVHRHLQEHGEKRVHRRVGDCPMKFLVLSDTVLTISYRRPQAKCWALRDASLKPEEAFLKRTFTRV
jgi:hypothetical protein